MADRRYVRIEDHQGTTMPFSKGILASSLMTTGVGPEDAYRLAEEIETELISRAREVVPVGELTTMVGAAVRRHLGTSTATTWSSWVQARRAATTTIVLIGGGTGVGKSTIATHLASRLGITRVVATDAIRELMRGLYPQIVTPTLHVSSFEAHRELRAPVPSSHDAVIEGFRQQSELVGVGVRMLVDRAITEQTGLIVEGAHLVPGMFASEWDRWSRGAALCQAVLNVTDPEAHRAHFEVRMHRASGRRAARYLEHFDEIRRIQRYILRQAEVYGAPAVEITDLDGAIRQVLQLVVGCVIRAQR